MGPLVRVWSCLLVAAPGAALACPDCGPARLARTAIFDASFFPTLGAVLAPLLLLALVSGGLYRLGAPPRSHRS